jgi:hypothetical protein
VTNEAENILASTYILQRYLTYDLYKENEELLKFIKVVKANIPIFSAARFGDINRSTLLKFLETISTTLIIMIQFHPDLDKSNSNQCSLCCQYNQSNIN